MTLTTFVTGGDTARRETLIAGEIVFPASTAVILEGLPTGKSTLDELGAGGLRLHRIAPACMCCSGNLTFRVTLNRVLRARPAHLYLGLASTEHLDGIRRFLAAPPYDALLRLTPDIRA